MTVEEYVLSRKYCRPSDRTSFINGIEEGKRQSQEMIDMISDLLNKSEDLLEWVSIVQENNFGNATELHIAMSDYITKYNYLIDLIEKEKS